MSRAELIDVSGWTEDEAYATYPEGARSKRAYFPAGDFPSFILPGRRYLLKRSDKRYPDQFWGEVVAAYVGNMLGVPVPPAYPAIDSRRDLAGALIEWFYQDSDASFVPAGNFMQQAIENFDRQRGTQHNFWAARAICKALQRLGALQGDWLGAWADALTFDALIGNTDRHQDNWGFLFVVKADSVTTSLAPWYDNGTSLGHERWPAHTAHWQEADFERYVRKGKHHLRWTVDSPAGCGFFEMPIRLVELDAGLKGRMQTVIDRLDFSRLEGFLAECRALPHPVPLTDWRCRFMIRLIKLRRDFLLQALS